MGQLTGLVSAGVTVEISSTEIYSKFKTCVSLIISRLNIMNSLPKVCNNQATNRTSSNREVSVVSV